MSLGGSKSRLAGVSRELILKWEDTKTYWQDAKAHEFDQHFMDPLFLQVDKTVTVIEKLDEILAKIKKDCE